MSVVGRGRIVEMELWDREMLDLAGHAFIEFDEDETGQFAFIAVEGSLDCCETCRDASLGVEFSWDGHDECDQASGRGWAVLESDGSLRGRIDFHLGDNSNFRAARIEHPSRHGATAAGRRPSEDR